MTRALVQAELDDLKKKYLKDEITYATYIVQAHKLAALIKAAEA